MCQQISGYQSLIHLTLFSQGKRFGKGKAFIVHATDGLILDKKKSGYYEGQWRENMR